MHARSVGDPGAKAQKPAPDGSGAAAPARASRAAPSAAHKADPTSIVGLLLWSVASLVLIHRFTFGSRPEAGPPPPGVDASAVGASETDSGTQLVDPSVLALSAAAAAGGAAVGGDPRKLAMSKSAGKTPSRSISAKPPTPSLSRSPASTPSPSGTPPAAAPVENGAPLPWEAHPKKYLMLVQGQEGFGAWSDMIWEYLGLAKELGRTLVEPCVRNGCLEPCRCGAVTAVPDVTEENVAERFAAGADPLDLPYISYPCEPYTSHAYERVGHAYPLSAYLDMRLLRQFWPHIVAYGDWCERVIRPDTSIATEPLKGRWVIPNAYCGELHWHECYPHLAPRIIGDFKVVNFTYGREPDLGRMMAKLHADPDTTIMFYYAYRRYFPGWIGRSNVPFNLGHIYAAKRFVAETFGQGAPLTVFHWRSEHVDELMLEPCAHKLSEQLGRFAWPATPSGARALLMSDMPAPNNNAILWHTYVGAKIGYQHAAMDVMLKEGRLIKYDYVHNATDTGVLMIRDFIFSQMADAYITCQGSFLEDCNGCFRSNSNFVGRIMETRSAAGKRVHDKWWALTQADLPGGA